MKKMMTLLSALLLMAATGSAMSYEQARNEALFLTDKMAYELNLTDEQYEAAYEINLDYLMGVTSYDDVFGTYWERRNLDMSYILLDWQWTAFRAATYFYRPLYWRDGFWHFGIYARYPHRDYFYFGRPVFYASYRGGHAWHIVGGRGYYYGHRDHFRPAAGHSHFGMLDRWNRGDYRHHHTPNTHTTPDHRQGGNRNSSTRYTVNGGHHSQGGYGNNSNLGGYRSQHGNSGNSRSSTVVPSATGTHGITNSASHSDRSSLGRGSSLGSASRSGSSVMRSSGSISSGARSSSSSGRSTGGGHSYGGRR